MRSNAFLPVVVAVGLAACGGPGKAGPVRFANAPPVTVVDDRRDVPEPPPETVFAKALYHYDGHFHRALTRWMEMRPDRRAANVNALGEVPDSTWFTNRIGVRDLSPAEIARGPNRTGSPEDHRPWNVISSKVGGASPGFIIEDARGEKFLLKFDKKGFPEMETGAHVVVQRLLWAVGFNVPEDDIVYFRREDLRVGPDAVQKDVFGNKKRLTPAMVDESLALVEVGDDGAIRGLVSKFLDGELLGPWPREGTRPGDPNDRVDHLLRRDLRGARAVFAWLDHTDIKGDNTIDVWEADPADPEHHYVVHYYLDFGNSLGTQAATGRKRYIGHEHELDFAAIGRTLVTFGMWPWSWTERTVPEIRGVGLFRSEDYDPGEWKPYTPSYFPLFEMDRFDAFWAASIIARFSKEQITAAVEQGRYSDPRAVEHIVRVLIERQRKTARYWFERVNPLAAFAVDGAQLCFDDLAVRYGYEPAASSHYSAVAFDYEGELLGWRARAEPGLRGRACVGPLPPVDDPGGYRIVKLDTYRSGPTLPGVLVHLAPGPGGGLRVIGVWRQ